MIMLSLTKLPLKSLFLGFVTMPENLKNIHGKPNTHSENIRESRLY
jgi:hypothetical protein